MACNVGCTARLTFPRRNRTCRLQSALEKLVHQAGEAKKRIQEQASLSQKCRDLKDANERYVSMGLRYTG